MRLLVVAVCVRRSSSWSVSSELVDSEARAASKVKNKLWTGIEHATTAA